MIRAHLAVVLLASALFGCATRPVSAPADSRILLFDSTGQLPPISASAAPPVTISDAPAADTRSRTIVGDGFRAQLTYGLGGGRQACGALGECRLGTVRISGRTATYVRFAEPKTIAGAPYSHRLVGYLPVAQLRPDEPGSGLLLNGWCNQPGGCDRLEQFFLSVRISR